MRRMPLQGSREKWLSTLVLAVEGSVLRLKTSFLCHTVFINGYLVAITSRTVWPEVVAIIDGINEKCFYLLDYDYTGGIRRLLFFSRKLTWSCAAFCLSLQERHVTFLHCTSQFRISIRNDVSSSLDSLSCRRRCPWVVNRFLPTAPRLSGVPSLLPYGRTAGIFLQLWLDW